MFLLDRFLEFLWLIGILLPLSSKCAKKKIPPDTKSIRSLRVVVDEETASKTNPMATFSGEQAPIAAPVDEQKAAGLKTPNMGTPEQQESPEPIADPQKKASDANKVEVVA
ncbi:hypothetical protein Aduo_000754 [Ancylostoma duodenale]